MKDNILIKLMLLSFVLLLVVALIAYATSLPDKKSDALETAASQKIYNILVLGEDSVAGLCDLTMLVSLNCASGDVNVMQIPRDTYYNFTDGNYKKINGAPRALGVSKFAQELGESLGIGIDYYLAITTDTVKGMVDALGGVTLNVPQNMDYDDPDQGLHIHLNAGEHTLDGESAVQFLRYRSGYVTGDLGRADAQKIFMAAFVKKLGTKKDPILFYKLLKMISDSGKMNIGERDILKVMKDMSGSDKGETFYLTAPGEAIRSEKSGAWYYILSRSCMNEILCERFGAKNDFDLSDKFVDKTVKRFYDIYEKRCEYKVHTADDIENDFLHIN